MTKRMLWMLIIVGVILGGVLGFQVFKSMMLRTWITSGGQPPVTVSTMTAQKTPWSQTLEATGTLRAAQGVDVTTEFAGMVRAVEFEPGAFVKEGEVLVRLNSEPEMAKLRSLEAARELAQITFDRDKTLYASRTISKQTLDVDEANLKSTIADLQEQKALLAKKTILAPFAGKLGITTVNRGQYLNAGDKIVTLQDLDPIFVDFYLPQRFVVDLEPGQQIQLTTNTYPNQVFKGEITSLDPKVDPQTRNIRIEAKLNNEQELLLPGMFANVSVIIGAPIEYLTLPQTAISFNPYGEVVFVVETQPQEGDTSAQKIAKSVFVKVKETRGDQAAVVDGVQEGDEVVVAGQLKLKNGSSIVIDNTILPANEANPEVRNEL